MFAVSSVEKFELKWGSSFGYNFKGFRIKIKWDYNFKYNL